jgi:hypothetical protein
MRNGDAKLTTKPPLYTKLAPVARTPVGNLLESIDGTNAHLEFATKITIDTKKIMKGKVLNSVGS